MDERGYAVNVENLLKRAEIFLSEGKFKKADEYCERVLDEDVRCARAYLLKVAAECRFVSVEMIRICFSEKIESNVNFKKACEYGDDVIRNFVEDCRRSYYAKKKEREDRERAEAEKEIAERMQESKAEANFEEMKERIKSNKSLISEYLLKTVEIEDSKAKFRKAYESETISAISYISLFVLLILSIILTVKNTAYWPLILVFAIGACVAYNFMVKFDYVINKNLLRLKSWMIAHHIIEAEEEKERKGDKNCQDMSFNVDAFSFILSLLVFSLLYLLIGWFFCIIMLYSRNKQEDIYEELDDLNEALKDKMAELQEESDHALTELIKAGEVYFPEEDAAAK